MIGATPGGTTCSRPLERWVNPSAPRTGRPRPWVLSTRGRLRCALSSSPRSVRAFPCVSIGARTGCRSTTTAFAPSWATSTPRRWAVAPKTPGAKSGRRSARCFGACGRPARRTGARTSCCTWNGAATSRKPPSPSRTARFETRAGTSSACSTRPSRPPAGCSPSGACARCATSPTPRPRCTRSTRPTRSFPRRSNTQTPTYPSACTTRCCPGPRWRCSRAPPGFPAACRPRAFLRPSRCWNQTKTATSP